MTADQIRLVQDSYAKVAPISGTAADLFCDRLFTIAQQLRPLFPSDLKEQKVKLVTMLAMAVKDLNDTATLVPVLEALGRRHVSYGVKPSAVRDSAMPSPLLASICRRPSMVVIQSSIFRSRQSRIRANRGSITPHLMPVLY